VVLDTIARRYGTDPWTVLQWPPERVAMAWTCIEAARARRRDVLQTRDDQGRPPSIWCTLDVDEL